MVGEEHWKNKLKVSEPHNKTDGDNSSNPRVIFDN